MEDKKNKQAPNETDASKKPSVNNTKIQIKDIDDLIFEEEYIKKHSEK